MYPREEAAGESLCTVLRKVGPERPAGRSSPAEFCVVPAFARVKGVECRIPEGYGIQVVPRFRRPEAFCFGADFDLGVNEP